MTDSWALGQCCEECAPEFRGRIAGIKGPGGSVAAGLAERAVGRGQGVRG